MPTMFDNGWIQIQNGEMTFWVMYLQNVQSEHVFFISQLTAFHIHENRLHEARQLGPKWADFNRHAHASKQSGKTLLEYHL